MVLTEEQQTDMYPAATMETATATSEESFYSNLSTTRVTIPSGYPANTPAGNARVAKVSAAAGAQKVGTVVCNVHVMLFLYNKLKLYVRRVVCDKPLALVNAAKKQ